MTGTFLPIELAGHNDFSLGIARRALTICHIDWLNPPGRGRELPPAVIAGMTRTLWGIPW